MRRCILIEFKRALNVTDEVVFVVISCGHGAPLALGECV
jgi:hypothetical protein